MLVLVDEAVASGRSECRDVGWRGFSGVVGRCRGSLFEGAVGSVLVVVRDVVGDEAFELLAVPDDGAVEEFAADRADPAFSERVGHWRAHGCAEDFEAFGSEDLVEAVDELAAAVANQSPCAFEAVGMDQEQIAGGLGGPRAGRVLGDTCEENLAGFDVDEEQDVVAAQECGVDSEEVARHGCLGT